MLGQPREIQGITAYETQVVGKHEVALADANRDFAPRWRYLAVTGNRILGSQGSSYTVIFDGQTGKWAGSGFFTDRFNANELIEATPSTITQNDAFGAWPGVRTGPAINIGRASSQGLCETIAGERICPGKKPPTSKSERPIAVAWGLWAISMTAPSPSRAAVSFPLSRPRKP
ncbi:MAG: hypothetical protein O2812_00675 [Chloroflexi bacterium]|nr:hypothetical protein [Chloroflexota bacterium]